MSDLEAASRTESVEGLREALWALRPEHDTPIGVVHPYWARKPMNVISTIIEGLSEPGDLVVDPFMGSGTTVFASLKSDRSAVGSDISPLSQFVVGSVLDLVDNAESLLPEIKRILQLHKEQTLPWFEVENGVYIERERFRVKGEFRNGAFDLVRTEIVTKQEIRGKWSARRTLSDLKSLEAAGMRDSAPPSRSPVDFEAIRLYENTRIAIPSGARLGHYFTSKNQASINALLQIIDGSPLAEAHSDALKLILSASLPMLRLSDKKASSQWPYWRPKENLTSRNPVMVLHERFKQIQAMVEWAKVEFPRPNLSGFFQILTLPAQSLQTTHLQGKADLVLTDPPYGDQVPYGEYSAMWNAILNLMVPDLLHNKELVRSNARHLREDSAEYLHRLADAFSANADLVSARGYLAWFYQDQDLNCWSTIYQASRDSGLQLVDVIPIPKQRRSLKTLTSPNATLDGDLLCVFSRSPDRGELMDSCAGTQHVAPTGCEVLTYFSRYARLIAAAMRTGDIMRLAAEYGTVKRALAAGEG